MMFAPWPLHRYLMLVAFVVALIFFPLLTRDPYLLHVMILFFLFAGFSSSWNLVMGYAGLKTIGHHAFFGIGAYASALLAMKAGWSPWATIFVGAAIASLAGLLLGAPLFRIRSMAHVAIVTLAFAEIVRQVLSNLTSLTRGEMGLWGIPPFPSINLPWLGQTDFGPADKVPMYFVALLAFVAVHAVILSLIRSRTGLALIAMRDAPDAAQSLGINLTLIKLAVFGVSALLVGFMGGIYAHYIAILTPTATVGPEMFILILAMVLVGGIGTFTGPIVGAFLLTLGIELLRFLGDYRLMIYGALVMLVMRFMPNGLSIIGRYIFRGGRDPDSGSTQNSRTRIAAAESQS